MKRAHRQSYITKAVENAAKVQAVGELEAGAYVVDVYHDDWCPLLAGKGACTCDAEVGPMKRIDDKTETTA